MRIVSTEYSRIWSTITLCTLHFLKTHMPCCDLPRCQSPLKALGGSMYTVVDFHSNGALRCNRAAQICDVLDWIDWTLAGWRLVEWNVGRVEAGRV